MMRLRVSGLPAARPVLNFSPRGTRAFTVFSLFFAVQTAMKRSPHPAGRALRTQRKFVALAWSRVTPHPPALRVTRQYIASTVLGISQIGPFFSPNRLFDRLLKENVQIRPYYEPQSQNSAQGSTSPVHRS